MLGGLVAEWMRCAGCTLHFCAFWPAVCVLAYVLRSGNGSGFLCVGSASPIHHRLEACSLQVQATPPQLSKP